VGVLDAGSLLSAFGAYLRGNEFSARWVAGIAAAFRRAGGHGALVRLPDAAIKASLRAAGLDHHRRSVTFDAPVADGTPPTTGYTDDPINTATGNFVMREDDLVCGGLVDGLTVARTYNSRSDRIGAFGRGWGSWATARLVPRPDGAEYVGPDGQEALFARMGAGFGRVVGSTRSCSLWRRGSRCAGLTGGVGSSATMGCRAGSVAGPARRSVCVTTTTGGWWGSRTRAASGWPGVGWRADRRAGVLGRPLCVLSL
jgi:Domain of unknown function (DUF6531)